MLRTIEFMTASGAGSRSRPTLLALAVFAVTLGILGMHGLGAHGVTTGARTPAAIAVPVAGHGDEKASVMSGGHAAHRPSPAEHSPADNGDDTHGTLMWCVAMLAAAAVALIAARVARTRRTRPWAVLAPAPLPGLPRPFVLRVGTGPPSVWSFSVIRC